MSDQDIAGLTWSACIPTLNRHDILMETLAHLLRQTRLPAQIIIADASDNWADGKARAAQVLAGQDTVELEYIHSPVRSSATQRNLAMEPARSDIVIMVDDDCFLYPDCAERLLEIYEADTAGEVVGIGVNLVATRPPAADSANATPRPVVHRDTAGGGCGLGAAIRRTRLGHWINREILFQSSERLFLRYDEPRPRQVPDSVAHLDVLAATFMPGAGMSFRRARQGTERFDLALRYYASFEDLDLSYRLGGHGILLYAGQAHVYHYDTPADYLKRKRMITFQLLNMAVFLKRHTPEPDRFLGAYRIMMARRVLSEFLKDALTGRWRFPQLTGVLIALQHWREVWAFDGEEIDRQYPDLQRRILGHIQ